MSNGHFVLAFRLPTIFGYKMTRKYCLQTCIKIKRELNEYQQEENFHFVESSAVGQTRVISVEI